jgi:hypothetical protein
MSVQPDTDRQLSRTGRDQTTLGARLLLLGGLMFVVGGILMLAFRGVGDLLGVALSALAAPPTLGGLALLVVGLFARRSAAHKPFV